MSGWDINMGAGLPPVEPEQLEAIEFEGKEFLVTPDTEEFRERLELDHLRARLLMGVAPVAPPSPPDNVNWERFQTPTRNQGDRGTCWAFGSIAAMEARYRRQHNLVLDLSEHYFFHLSRATVLRGDYLTPTLRWENTSSYWEGGGNSTSISALANLAATEEVNAPYQSQAALNTLRESLGLGDLNNPTQEELDLLEWDDRMIPRAARWGGRYRTNQWTSVAYDIDSLERQIAAGNEVLLDITVKWRFDAATDTYVTENASAGGGHVVLLVGYDRSDQLFRIKNSWGEGRIVNLSYDFVRQHSLGATVLNSVHPVGAPDRRQWWLGRWNMDHDGWRGTLVIRRFADQGAPTKLGNYYRDGNSFDVNGFMAQDGLRASFAIAPSPGKKTPGDMTGQRFDAYVFSWDQPNAAGVTTWNGVKFGAQLSRNQLPAFRPEVFDIGKWVGVWDMNHDGWRGTLTIDRIDPLPLVGSIARLHYHDGNGVERTASGIILQGLPHQMQLSVTFDGPPQLFALYAHTWERGFFSGTTAWGNATFGVIGRKRG